MTSPTLELQGAIVSRLKSYPAVTALVGNRVYDSVPADAEFPYISIGPSDEITEDADCIRGFDISMQIDVWSREPGHPQARRIADAVQRALHEQDLALTDNALVYFRHRQTRFLRDPDGLTTHAAITFEAFVEQP